MRLSPSPSYPNPSHPQIAFRSIGVSALLLLGQGGDEFAAEVGDVGDQAAPDHVEQGRETAGDVSERPP